MMKFRVARHTTNLEALIFFYGEVLGLRILGSFKNHEGYDGIFLGHPGENWHLEFTVSNQAPDHHADEDDQLVFYPLTLDDYDKLVAKIQSTGIQPLAPKNPYWLANGTTFADPDRFRVVIAKPVSA
jgi:extradiol dioxygenase family protein